MHLVEYRTASTTVTKCFKSDKKSLKYLDDLNSPNIVLARIIKV